MNTYVQIEKEKNVILEKAFSCTLDTKEGIEPVNSADQADVIIVLHPDIADDLLEKGMTKHIIIALLAIPPERQIEAARCLCDAYSNVSMCFTFPSEESEKPDFVDHVVTVQQSLEESGKLPFTKKEKVLLKFPQEKEKQSKST